jgi:acyl-CoA synthetase (AMP-forming)/AMP-acid ligase II
MVRPAANADSLLLERVERDPGRAAITLEQGNASYHELNSAVERIVDRLAAARAGGSAARLVAGERVAVIAPNVLALVVATFAIWRTGAVAVPLNARLREYELRRVLKNAQASAVITLRSWRGYSFADLMPDLLPALPTVRSCLFVDAMGTIEEELAQPVQADAAPVDDSVAAILYTSGTTGEPKGAFVRHSTLLAGATGLAEILGLEPTDVIALPIPASHAFGLGCLLAGVATGGQTVLVDSTFSPQPLLDAISMHQATVLHGSPAVFTGLLKSKPEALPTLRTGLVGGAACPPRILEELDDAGTRILNAYGMTEIGAACACRSDDPPEVRYETVGRPLPGYEFRVVSSGAERGDVGEVQVRGPYVTPGYYGLPKESGEAFHEGWFRTGDLGSLDAFGNLRLSGRVKDLVLVSGFNVFPAEVENLLLTHPDVVEAAVVGVPHETFGEVLRAFVVLEPGSELGRGDLVRFARGRIAAYKIPYDLRILPELPRLASGKADRTALVRSTEKLRAVNA